MVSKPLLAFRRLSHTRTSRVLSDSNCRGKPVNRHGFFPLFSESAYKRSFHGGGSPAAHPAFTLPSYLAPNGSKRSPQTVCSQYGVFRLSCGGWACFSAICVVRIQRSSAGAQDPSVILGTRQTEATGGENNRRTERFKEAQSHRRILRNRADVCGRFRTHILREHYSQILIALLFSLTRLRQHFLTPIIASLDTPQPLLDRTELTSVFSNFIDIWNLHRSFFSSLTHFLHTSTSQSPDISPLPLSPILLSHFPYLSLYTPFVTSFPDMLSSYAALLSKNTAFASFIALQEADPRCGKLKLRDWLLTIVQRCPRYLLLLKDLINCTDSDDSEHASLIEVQTLVSKSKSRTINLPHYRDTNSKLCSNRRP